MADKKIDKQHSEYDKIIETLQELVAFTERKEWLKLFAFLKQEIRTRAAALLTEEKTRDIIGHQQAVAMCEKLIDWVRQPLQRLEQFNAEMPLFAGKQKAVFDEATGRVRLEKVSSKKKN